MAGLVGALEPLQEIRALGVGHAETITKANARLLDYEAQVLAGRLRRGPVLAADESASRS